MIDDALPFNASPGGISHGAEIDLHPTDSEPRHDRVRVARPLSLETRGTSAQRQLRLPWVDRLALKDNLARILHKHNELELSEKLDNCRRHQTVKMCRRCGSHSVFSNRCDLLFCPCCQTRLVKDRHKRIGWWIKEMKQPKHVCLTVRNSPVLTKEYIKWAKGCLKKLRRSKLCENWKGGFWSMEITNEGKGWHLHFHLLVEARWIDHGNLKWKWAQLVEQDQAIVWVKDARETDYLKEVSKYICKPDQILQWEETEIVQFVRIINKTRTFGVFGTLHGKRTEFKEWLASLEPEEDTCECGACDWEFVSPDMFEWKRATMFEDRAPPPKPEPDPQLEFGLHRQQFLDAVKYGL